jgi:hypothetical protein
LGSNLVVHFGIASRRYVYTFDTVF